MTFKRKIYGKLLNWKADSQGRSALLIEGARRIGKSTIVEEFARNEYDSYILIDFAFASKDVRGLFDDMTDLSFFFLQLQLQYKVELTERKSLIVFDEVQFCPKARQAIKILVKDGRYDYIETGSLISLKRNVKDILIPSEERRIEMHPMDFEEFCMATNNAQTTSLLRKAFEARIPLGEAGNRKLIRLFRLYMLVGGMPQAVSEYIASNNFKRVDQIKRDILQLYEDDFVKIDPTGKASMLFSAIPAQLSANVSRYHVSSVSGNLRYDDISELLFEMAQSKTVLLSYNASNPQAGLAANISNSCFKMFLCDTGLFVTMMFKDREFTENTIYEKILSDKLSANLGYLYENVIAQTLAANGYRLYYHTWSNAQTRHHYEVDFLLANGNKICPLEVKSSGYRKHSSLDEFCLKYSDRISEKYLVYTKDYARHEGVDCLPFYMAQFL